MSSTCSTGLSDIVCDTGRANATERPASCSLLLAEAEVATAVVATAVVLRPELASLAAVAGVTVDLVLLP